MYNILCLFFRHFLFIDWACVLIGDVKSRSAALLNIASIRQVYVRIRARDRRETGVE